LGAAIAYIAYRATRDPVDRAIQLSARGRISEATSLLEEHVAENRSDARALFELGKLRWAGNQLESAAASFEKAADLEPHRRDALLAAVVCLASLGAETTRDREIALLERAVSSADQDMRTWQLLGLARATKQDMAGATDAFQKAIGLGDPGATAHQFLGAGLGLQGNYSGAEQELNKAFQTNPQDPTIPATLALLASLQGDPERAAAQLGQTTSIQGPVGDAVSNQLGVLMVSQGRFDEAQPYFDKLLGVGKANPTAQFFRALCLQARGLTKEAIAEYETISRDGGAFAARAALQSAQLHLSQGEAERAGQALEKASQLGADAAPLHTARGRLHALRGDLTQAQEAYKAAIQSDPGYAAAHLENGLVYIKRQVFTEGIRELERYLELAGADREGTRTEAIQEFVQQLKQTLSTGGPTHEPRESPAGSTML
jgi:tetratricopeptide (TPR) repeat protein